MLHSNGVEGGTGLTTVYCPYDVNGPTGPAKYSQSLGTSEPEDEEISEDKLLGPGPDELEGVGGT